MKRLLFKSSLEKQQGPTLNGGTDHRLDVRLDKSRCFLDKSEKLPVQVETGVDEAQQQRMNSPLVESQPLPASMKAYFRSVGDPKDISPAKSLQAWEVNQAGWPPEQRRATVAGKSAQAMRF